MRKVFIKVILFLIILFPFKVGAVNYGDCITNFGSIKIIEKGNNNNGNGNIDYSKTKNNTSWGTEDVTFDVNVQAPLGNIFGNDKVKKVKYKITSFGEQTCSGEITGSDLEDNEGNVKFHVVINKGYVEKIKFSGVSVSPFDSKNIDSITGEELSIKHEDDESSNIKNDAELGDIMASDGMASCDSGISDLIKKYWKWVVFLTPLLLIVMMTIDFVKAMSSNDADAVKKSSNNAIRRVIAAVILLALPWAIKVIFTWFGIEQFLCF